MTSIKTEGIQHEYSVIPGVMEPVTDVILNIKGLVIKSHSKVPKTVYIKADTRGTVKAQDIICDETIEIINPEQHHQR